MVRCILQEKYGIKRRLVHVQVKIIVQYVVLIS